jgi:hypothetical protein
MVIWYILWSFGIFSLPFGMLYQEKSGNPGLQDLWLDLQKSVGNTLTNASAVEKRAG